MEALEGDLAVAFQEAIAKIAPDVEVLITTRNMQVSTTLHLLG